MKQDILNLNTILAMVEFKTRPLLEINNLKSMKTITYTIVFSIICLFVQAQTVGLKVISTGDVGIGTATPIEKLDVNGAIKIGTTTTANPGTIRFTGNCFEGYDGLSWVALGGSGCAGGPLPSCTDGIQNQGETGVDCGGPCAPCSTGGCESFPDIIATRDLPNAGWNNEYNVGGTGISGDGVLYFKLDFDEGNTDQVIGLSDNPTANANKNTINYGIRFYFISTVNRYWFGAVENGALKGGWQQHTSSISGSTFEIERSGTTVSYKKDGTVFYTSTTSSSGTLLFDNSFYDSPANATWGLRPSSIEITDIDLCPAGSFPLISAAPAFNSPNVSVGNNFEQYAISLSNIEDDYLSQPTPNPFFDRAIVLFKITSDFFDAEVVFTDSFGRELGRQEITEQQGEIQIDSSDLGSGLYQYSLVVDGQIVKTNKMVVVK